MKDEMILCEFVDLMFETLELQIDKDELPAKGLSKEKNKEYLLEVRGILLELGL